MRQYILIKNLHVQNVNAISGLTYGFPAITNFLGFAHALSRKLSSDMGVTLGGTAVFSHKTNVHVRQPRGWGDYVFALTRNPLTHQGKTSPINEEGRMDMHVSLAIEVCGLIAGDVQTEAALIDQINSQVPCMRLAGGQVLQIGQISFLNNELEQKKALRRLMPASVLCDRSSYLETHLGKLRDSDSEASILDAWCDFAKIKYKATPLATDQIHETTQDGTESTRIKATWGYVPKPQPGFLVPIATGYRAISKVYDPGEVTNVRDVSVPAAFAETAYSIGEWLSVHRLNNINAALWNYQYQHPWYLAVGDLSEVSSTKIEAPEFFSDTPFDPDL